MGTRLSSVCFIATLLFSLASPDAFAQDKKAGAGTPPKLKVAFALLSTIHDLGWTTAHYQGIEYV